MNTSLIKLLLSLVMWLVKILSPTTSDDREEGSEEQIAAANKKITRTTPTKIFAPMTTPQAYSHSRVAQTILCKRTSAGTNKVSFPTNVITHEPTTTKSYPAVRPRPRKKLAQMLIKYGSLRQAIVVSELLQHRDF